MKDMMAMIMMMIMRRMTTTTIIQYMVPNVHTDRTGAMSETDYQRTICRYIFDAQTIDEKLITREYYHKTACFNIGFCF
jgi:hypothetical protein